MKIKFLLLLFLLSCSFQNKKEISYNYKNEYWTNDFDEIELVMSYALNSKDYHKMLQMNNIEKIDFLDKYWELLDPVQNTSNNELLEELNNRVLESKELFSGFDGGLLSDRAKIYIIYGPPNNKYKASIDNYELITWHYKTGYEFNFISDSFGRYKLKN